MNKLKNNLKKWVAINRKINNSNLKISKHYERVKWIKNRFKVKFKIYIC